MADTFTPNFEFVLPEVGGSLDSWGDKLNVNFASLDTLLSRAMPPGGIIMWSGPANQVPAGWRLCNGNNGTPDLRGRFVVGAGNGSGYSVGDTGGANNVTLNVSQLPAHNHGGKTAASTHSHGGNIASGGHHDHTGSTTYDGTHAHGVHIFDDQASGGLRVAVGRSGQGYGTVPGASAMNSAGNHNHNLNINGGGSHSHGLTINSNTHDHNIPPQGDGNSHENRPPYYALAYIMKI